jgi:hypothetical protein
MFNTAKIRELPLSRIKPPRLRGGMNSCQKRFTKDFSIPAALAAETVSPPKGGRCILSAIEVVFASQSTVHLNGRSRVFILF